MSGSPGGLSTDDRRSDPPGSSTPDQSTSAAPPADPARPPVTLRSLRRIRAALGYGLVFMMIGGLLFTLAGFGFTALAGTSCFEGLCAYVPFLWFAPLGMITGFVLGAKLGSRKADPAD